MVSLYDTENNAVRQLGAHLRSQGHRVVEIYFKDWRNNRLEAPTHKEMERLVQLLEQQDIGLIGVSLRASAYEKVASRICQMIRAKTGLPLVLGGWHPTVRPENCMPFADALCLGEGDHSFPEFVRRFFEGKGALSAVVDTPGFHLRLKSGKIQKNPLPPLVETLDSLPWRDYVSEDKWLIHRSRLERGDPMKADPLYQVLCSIGCIQSCSFCHNSFDTGAAGARLRFRSVSSVLDELTARRNANPGIRRVRFDDEIFGLNLAWLREFAERYPREVGLPFDVLTEPTVVSEEYADLLQKAGAKVVHMGIQSTESVNREKLARRADRETTAAAVKRLSARGIRIRYLVMVDIPEVGQQEMEELLQFLGEVPRPYDLYLFSLTYFPGTSMVEEMLREGVLHPAQIEGSATKTFSQYRVDLGWPRESSDTWWLALLVLTSSHMVPGWLLDQARKKEWGKKSPRPLVVAAHLATLLKTMRVAGQMVQEGELTPTLVRRWWNPLQMITM